MMKRSLSLVISIILMVCLALSASAADPVFADTQGHYAQQDIERLSGYGVLKGSEGLFRPDEAISRAELAALLDRVMKYTDQGGQFADVPSGAWYAENISKAAAAGVLKGHNGLARPNDKVSRQEAAVMVCRAFKIEAVGSHVYSDDAAIASWAKEAVAALYNKGVMTGYGNEFRPEKALTRAEAASILSRLAAEIVSQPGVYSSDVKGPL